MRTMVKEMMIVMLYKNHGRSDDGCYEDALEATLDADDETATANGESNHPTLDATKLVCEGIEPTS